MYDNVSWIFLNSAPLADTSKCDETLFKAGIDEQNKLLVDSASRFDPSVISDWKVSEVNWFIEYFKIGLWPQSHYSNIPFCDIDYEKESTIATDGGALLVATFVEYLFKKTQSFTLEDMADAVIEKGYRSYIEKENGTYKSDGCKPVIFDLFVPSIFRLKVAHAEGIEEILDSIVEYKLPVVMVKNSVYKDDSECEGSKYIAILGYNKHGLTVFDPEEEGLVLVPYERITRGIMSAWIFEKK